MRKQLGLIVAVSVIVIVGFCYRCGGEFVKVAKRSFSEGFYQKVIEIFIPAFSYYEDMVWEDDPEEYAKVDYENLAIVENEQMGGLIAENSTYLEELVAEQEAAAEAEAREAEREAAALAAAQMDLALREKQVIVNREKLHDYDYLRQNFYIIDSSTTAGSELLNVDKLLGKDMAIEETDSDGPQILIYHTHSQECYIDSAEGDANTSVIAVGEYLTQILTEKYGFKVLHHTGEYDVGDRDHAYSNAAPALEQILAEYPSIQVVIDLHRDSVNESTHLVTDINGKPTAKIMFFNGLSYTTAKGELMNLPNPYLEDNLALSFQLQLAAAEYYPDFTRQIYLKGYRYNMHYCPKSLLVEVGAQNNTFEEAKNAMEPLADILDRVLHGKE